MFEAALIIATLLCGLVAGLLFAFAVVAMPGIATLPDRAFLRAFQVMDRVIQNNQPLFMLAWVGSVIALVAALVVAFVQTSGLQLWLLIAAASVYLLGVQLPTVAINIPLNNHLQQVDVDGAGGPELAREREAFEPRWNKWNRSRATLAVTTTALLLISLAQT